MLAAQSERPKVDDLVCCSCYTGPGQTQESYRDPETHETKTRGVNVSAMSLMLAGRDYTAQCKSCGGKFDPKDLRRWNVTMLPMRKSLGHVMVTPIVSMLRSRRT